MRLVVSTDWHGDRDTLGVSRTSEVRSAVKQSVSFAIETKADAYLFAGDLADPDSGGATFRAQEIAIEAAHDLAREGIRSIWIAGNHDVNEDGTGATCLSVLAAIERAKGCSELIYVAERPRVIDLSEDVCVLCMPYVPISHGYSPSEYASGVFRGADMRIITLSHLMIPGVVLGEETTEMPRGRDVAFPLAETERALVRIQGHYHTRQTFMPEGSSSPIYIPGSLCRFTFGDEQSEPGYLVIEI